MAKILLFLVTAIIGAVVQVPQQAKASGTFGTSLQFFGNQVNDIDRVKIPLTPNKTIDVGQNFTLEWWMKTSSGNNAGTCRSGAAGVGDYDWITGNILFDRDINSASDNGKYGISLIGAEGGRISFGVAQGTNTSNICSTATVGDGQWHHVAATRNAATGEMCIYIDGRQSGCKRGPTGDISYRDDRVAGNPNSDPFFVIAAEKHDFAPGGTGYHGLIDEVRMSNSIRYTGNFSVPTQPFLSDGNTVALYHFGEGASGGCSGSILDVTGINNGTCRFGGTQAGPQWSNDAPSHRCS